MATPALVDPHFDETVVLLLDVNDDGALGVVLNRPGELPVADVLDPWGTVVAAPEVLFEGGPVETNGALAVVWRRAGAVTGGSPSSDPGDEADGAETPGLRTLGGGLALLDLDAPPEVVGAEIGRLRIFAGYSGWGAGQLEAEIDEGSWYVVPGEAADVFRADTSTLRRDVLRRQPGDLAWHATRPRDPEQN